MNDVFTYTKHLHPHRSLLYRLKNENVHDVLLECANVDHCNIINIKRST